MHPFEPPVSAGFHRGGLQLCQGFDGRPLSRWVSSLGFSTIGDTHLKRLDEAGHKLGLDQRQVRRLSDQGFAVLATLISTNWTVEAVPELTAIIKSSSLEFELMVTTSRPLVVEMGEPDLELFTADSREILDCDWQRTSAGSGVWSIP